MNKTQFKKIMYNRLSQIEATLDNKAIEYAQKDRLYNFKRAAEIERTTPAKALWGMMSKHLVSVIDMIEGALPAEKKYIDEKIGDTINYLILLEAIFSEET